jgi:hypothetical protein
LAGLVVDKLNPIALGVCRGFEVGLGRPDERAAVIDLLGDGVLGLRVGAGALEED